MKQLQYRQGDVLLVKVGGRPRGTWREVARTEGRVILALGEATGHAHAVLEPHAVLKQAAGVVDRYLEVLNKPATLVHEEHDSIKIEPGLYRVVRQREYDEVQERQVLD